MPVSQVVLAQLAAAAYRETSTQNRIEPPADWSLIVAYPEAAQTTGGALTGFSAAAYRGPGGEIVIAYTGTKDWKDWPAGNLPAATGTVSPQVVQAAQFYGADYLEPIDAQRAGNRRTRRVTPSQSGVLARLSRSRHPVQQGKKG
jgi:hypothetical protein